MIRNLYSIAILSILFPWLFYHKGIGLNLFLFNMIVIAIYYSSGYFKKKGLNYLLILSGTVLSAFLVVLIHTGMTVFINLVSLFLLSGVLCYPEARSLLNSLRLSFSNIFLSQKMFWTELNRQENRRFRLSIIFKWMKTVFIPIVIIILFIFLYKAANPFFDKHVTSIFTYIGKQLQTIVSFPLLFTFLLGLLISTFLLINNPLKKVIDRDMASDINLLRKKKKQGRFRINGLWTELKAAVFLLIFLNLLILAENIIDIYWVWFNFEWNGDYLKQFVHEGTYLLILSILISIGITLYFFRGNLNFFSRNKMLKILSYIWLFQNIILTVSVGLRNYRYIETFALAFKRIGVFFFLALALLGIFTVMYKIRRRLSAFYLFKVNTAAIYVILVLISVFNWDIIIARYNFRNYEKSFVHLDFLSTLSDNALPFTDRTMEELTAIDKVQKNKFNFEETFMSPYKYYVTEQKRKSQFIQRWESKKMLEWNFAGQRTYKKLMQKKNK